MATPLLDLNCRSSYNRAKSFESLIFLFLSLFLFVLPTTSSYEHSSSSQIPYSPYCNRIVPESTPTDSYRHPFSFLQLSNAYVANAHQFLGSLTSQIAANFRVRRVFRTQNSEIQKIDGTLQFRVSRIWGFSQNSTGRRLLRVYGGPRVFRFGRAAMFQLSGFWSSSSGQLCMVGSGRVRSLNGGKNLNYNVVFKLKYPNISSIVDSLVSGRLESLDSEGSDGYFRPISVLDFSRMNYEYSLIKKEIGNDYLVNNRASSPERVTRGNCFDLISLSDRFKFDYGGSCGGRNCTPIDRLFGFLPKFLSMNLIDCSSDQLVRFSFGFSNSSNNYNGFLQPFKPGNTLVAEGAWNENGNQLRFIACSILTDSLGNASIGDCSVRLNFTLASKLSIRSRSPIDGQMWSNKSVAEVGYFERIGFRTSGSKRLALPSMRYEYTEIERANRYCSGKKATGNKGKHYPDPYSIDMKFDMEVKNNNKQKTWGSAIPIYVDDHLVLDGYKRSHFPTVKHLGTLKQGAAVNHTRGMLVNISYLVTFKPLSEIRLGGKNFSKQAIDIPAEGTYDPETGLLCMVGCWTREADGAPLLNRSTQVDCEIFIKVQFPQKSNAVAKGTIESKRQISDPFYFGKLELLATSFTELQVDKSIWRMDLEITMVLVSNTLACIFLLLQLLHVKSHPEVLPFISVVMLFVLTLGHMIPLLLNFDAFLSNRKRKNVLLGTGDWLEINEVVVRVITMIAFLLEVRLLQLTWSSRGSSENQKILWVTEKKVIYLSLPLCLLGALVAWFLHPWKSSYKTSFLRLRYQQVSRWHELKAYAGLVLDAFLFPQIIFNIFCDSKEKALAPAYYIGTTIVRLLPHAYDLFRAHSSTLKFDLWYIYANPRMNFYSTSWDIIISCCGLLFAIVIYLQQRFGSRWLLPPRLEERYEYEIVPLAVAETK